jgi:hypothetical protein
VLGIPKPPALEVDLPEPIERLEILRVAANDVAVEARRVHQLTRLMESQGILKQGVVHDFIRGTRKRLRLPAALVMFVHGQIGGFQVPREAGRVEKGARHTVALKLRLQGRVFGLVGRETQGNRLVRLGCLRDQFWEAARREQACADAACERIARLCQHGHAGP